MNAEHTENLTKLREMLVDRRRFLVDNLIRSNLSAAVAGYKTELVEYQQLINTVGQALEEITHIRVSSGCELDCVVDIPVCLPPGIEDNFLVGVVGMQCGHDALERIVENDRTNSHSHSELEVMGGAEKRFITTHRIALVVVDGPTASYPARVAYCPSVN